MSDKDEAASTARDGERRSGGGARSLAQLVPKLARATIGKRGFAEAGLLSDWSAVVGHEIAEKALPERLDFPRGERREGTLHLSVAGAWATTLQHLEPQLVERINSYFGYRAVARLKLHQGALPPRRKKEPAAEEPAAQDASAPETGALEAIADPELRAALRRLGRVWPASPRGEKRRG